MSAARRRSAGARDGGRFAPGPALDPPERPTLGAAAQIDALAARAAAKIGQWMWTPGGRAGPEGCDAVYESDDCTAVAGPFAGAVHVTLRAVCPVKAWLAEADMHHRHQDPRWASMVTVRPASGPGWPSHTEAIEAIEAVLAAAPEASELVVTVTPGPGFVGDSGPGQTWDWQSGAWAAGETA